MRTRDEAKEAAIRKKAMELIVLEGFDGLSMHKLAKSAGVSVATIYIYYKDREDLLHPYDILPAGTKERRQRTRTLLRGFLQALYF